MSYFRKIEINAWQALLLYHIRNGSVFGLQPVTFSGQNNIRKDGFDLDGTIQIDGNQIKIDPDGIEIYAPSSFAIGSKGNKFKDIIDIPLSKISVIDDGVDKTKVDYATVCGDKIRFVFDRQIIKINLREI